MLRYLPSLGIIIFIFIQAQLFIDCTGLVNDAAAGRHLRTAQYILEHGIPRVNPFGIQIPWIDFEWGFEATIGSLGYYFGVNGPVWLCVSLFSITIYLLWRMLIYSKISPLVCCIILGLVGLTLSLQWLLRPLMFTWLFMAAIVSLYSTRKVPHSLDWYFLPLLFLFWANLHSGWLAGLIFIAASLAGRMLDTKNYSEVLAWSKLCLCCLLITLINPYGYHLWLHEIQLTFNPITSQLWYEFAVPNFATPTIPAVIILLSLAVFIVGRASSLPKWTWETTIPFLLFLYFGLKAQRHVLLFSIVAAIPLAKELDQLIKPKANLLLQGICKPQKWELPAIVSVLLITGYVYCHMFKAPYIDGAITPTVVNLYKANPAHFQHPLTTATNGGPLLWNLRPNFKVSFDDRGEMYGNSYVLEQIRLEQASPGWQIILDNGHYDSAFLEPSLPLNQVLQLLPDWKIVYQSKVLIIYQRLAPN